MISSSVVEEEILESAPEQGERTRLVPVTESIRYRRRAQTAEKEIEVLSEQLNQAKGQVQRMAEQLNEAELAQKLTHKLAAAGVIDIEAAALIAKARIGNGQADMDNVIEQLKKEKRYLFGNDSPAGAARKTACAKGVMNNVANNLQKAARKAAGTGSRTDLQEYLKLRRNMV